MKTGRFSIFALVLAAATLCVSAWGQATTSLHGTVLDPSGAAIAGAKVTITATATNVSRSTMTTSTGSYSFPAVLPGVYSLTVKASGFQTWAETGLQLMVSLPASRTVQMKVGSNTQTVQVTGIAPLLNTTDPSLGNTMGTESIENLPVEAENMTLLLSFQPGVVYNGTNALESNYDSRAGSVNGERSDQNNITLDGVSDNNEFEGYAFNGILPTTQFSIQEFRVTTSNYDATEGRSSGAQITMETKSGTNLFHGNLYEFNRNTWGLANDYFLKQSQLANGQANRPGKLIRNIFGGDLGGPLVHNKTFFFFNYEGHRTAHEQSTIENIPSSTLRDGIIEYGCSSAAVTAGQCPGGSVTGISGASYTVPAGSYALSPTQLMTMDPIHEGPDPAALAYFATYPTPNAPATLDAPNYAGYRFASPYFQNDNWYIARLDHTFDSKDSLFLRGEAVHDRDTLAGPFQPGHPPQSLQVDFSKGLVAGYTRVFGPTLVNNFRYGITKESVGNNGDSNQPWVYMRDLNQDAGNYTSAATAPVHNFVDTVSLQHGSHNFQVGANILLIRRHDYTNGNSFSDALTNADWIAGGGFAGKGNALDPGANGYPAVGTAHAYDFPLAAMMGMASEIDAHYNYAVASRTTATPLGQGANVQRHWATDTYSLFFQDTWQARHDLSITYGLDYQLMTPITEIDGQQVAPSVNMGQWFNQRASEMLKGIPSNHDALIKFQPAGSYWGGPGLYSAQTKNFAPRLGFAWSPHPSWNWLESLTGQGQTSVRGGFGMYYDNFGPALAMNYDASGSFGLASVLENPAATLTIGQVPRITSMNVIPTTDNSGNTIMEPPPPSTYPATYPQGAEAIATGIDQSIKTPYSYAVDFSIERQLPGNMTLDVAYVGHYGHGELALDDIAEPLDLRDPKTGIDYFTAVTALAKLARQGVPLSAINAATVGPSASYWSDMFGAQSQYNICSTGANTPSILQAAYDLFEGPGCGSEYNETTGLYITDVAGYPFKPLGGLNSYFNSQFSSLWAWRSMSNSNYHALQVSLHKQMSNGVLFGFNYTYSHSLDIASFAERSAHFLTDSIINAWDPHQMYASSDFDLRHQINGYWLAKLPFGRGEALGRNSNRIVDGLIGGWQLGGTTRWSSGFPWSAFMGYVWPTNWDEMGWANEVKPAATEGSSGYSISQGAPNVFKNPTSALSDFDYAFPGQSGTRNNLRGQGFFDTDMNLAKKFRIVEHQNFEIRWQVFNAFNNTRFDVQSIQDEQDAGNFGSYTGELSTPREMEFAGVYTF
jgi:hypothetical protein